MGESSEEEDYMSDAFLKQCEDVRPGLMSSKSQREIHVQKSHSEKNVKNKTKKLRVLESEKREEGLGVALGSNNKGFALLQKMGYKPGTGIGKEGQGRVEPVPVALKTNRGGLGQESHQKRKQEMATMRRFANATKRKKMEEKRKGEFLERKSQQFLEKESERDLYKSQKVCEQLDSQKGLSEPEELFYWPAALIKGRQPVISNEESISPLSEDEQGYRLTAYEEEEEEECLDKELDEDELGTTEKLNVLTEYLRTRHLYCVWCATNFNDEADLSENCPGSMAEDHR